MLLLSISCATTADSVDPPIIIEKPTVSKEEPSIAAVPEPAVPITTDVAMEAPQEEVPAPALANAPEETEASEEAPIIIETTPAEDITEPALQIEEKTPEAEVSEQETIAPIVPEEETVMVAAPIIEEKAEPVSQNTENTENTADKQGTKTLTKTIDKLSVDLPIIQIVCIVIAILAIAVGVAVSRKMTDKSDEKIKKRKTYETPKAPSQNSVKPTETKQEIHAEPVVIIEKTEEAEKTEVPEDKALNVDILITAAENEVSYTMKLREEPSINVKASFPIVHSSFEDSQAYTYASIMKSAEKNADKNFLSLKGIYDKRNLHFTVKCDEKSQRIWERAYDLKDLTSFSLFEKAFKDNVRGERSIDSSLTFQE